MSSFVRLRLKSHPVATTFLRDGRAPPSEGQRLLAYVTPSAAGLAPGNARMPGTGPGMTSPAYRPRRERPVFNIPLAVETERGHFNFGRQMPYRARFQTTSSIVPIWEAGFVYFSSSAETELMTRF